MAIKAAKLVVEIGAETGGLMNGLRSAQRSFTGFAQSAAASMSGFLGAQLFQAAANGLLNMGKAALDATVNWERLGFTIESMIARELRQANATMTMTDAIEKAGDKTKETLAWIAKLSIRSPFSTDTVASAYRMQLSLGATTDQAKQTTSALLDMAAATGMSEEQLSGAAYALSQIRSSDKLLTQDLRQLINAGIDVNGILAKIGVKFSEVGQKAIPTQKFIDAFLRSAEEYGGAVDRMAGSWSGLLGALADAKNIGLRELFAGTLQALRPLVAELTDFVLGPGLPKLREWGDKIGAVIAGILPGVRTLAVNGFAFLEKGLNWLIANAETIKGALLGVAAGLSALLVVTTIAGAISALSNPITWLIGAFALIGIAWQRNFGGIQQIAKRVMSVVMDYAMRLRGILAILLPQAIEKLREIWETRLMPPLMAAYGWFQERILPILAELWSAISELAAVLFKIGSDVISRFVLPALQKMWQWLGPKLSEALRFLAKAFEISLKGIVSRLRRVTAWLERVRVKLQNVKLPAWLMPGSPTPFEIGLRGIAGALREIQRVNIADTFAAPILAPVPVASPAFAQTGGGERVINLTINASDARMEDVVRVARKEASAMADAILAAIQGAYK